MGPFGGSMGIFCSFCEYSEKCSIFGKNLILYDYFG